MEAQTAFCWRCLDDSNGVAKYPDGPRQWRCIDWDGCTIRAFKAGVLPRPMPEIVSAANGYRLANMHFAEAIKRDVTSAW